MIPPVSTMTCYRYQLLDTYTDLIITRVYVYYGSHAVKEKTINKATGTLISIAL